MAELAGDGYGYDETPARPWRRQAGLALGAAVALGLIWALGGWAHGLLTRDAGEIPFLRAEPGPYKVAPEDPGGLTLDRADRAVERMMDGAGGSETALAPASEMPAEEDLPAPRLDPDAPLAPEPGSGPDAIEAAVAKALAESGEAGAPSPAPAREIEAGEFAPAVSRPAPARPRDVAALRAQQAAAPAEEAPARALAAGDQAVQLGAFNTATIAESQWRRHLDRNADLLDELSHAVTTVESGGRTLYRLRAGPLPDRKRAQELCAALKARRDACITARMR